MLKFSRIAAAILASGACGSALAGAAPQPAVDPARQAFYDSVAKLPDWSGAWDSEKHTSVVETSVAIPLTPKYAAELAALRRDVKAGKPMPSNPQCKPKGVPLFMEHTGPLLEIIFAHDRVVMLSGDMQYRVIYTDGRKLELPQIDPTTGNSVGRWEGDTLVVETIGIYDGTWVFPGIANGGGLHVLERIRLSGPNTLEDQITLTNEKMFTRPYTYTARLTRHRDWDLDEYVCLPPSHTDYGVGPKPSKEEEEASSMVKPPVRQMANTTPDTTLPGGSWANMAKLPDWDGPGIWQHDSRPSEHNTNEFIPLTPEFQKRLAELRKISDAGGDIPTDNYHCRPRGPAQLMKGAPATFYFLFTPGRVTLVPELAETRRFYTDGRGHPANLEISFYGHSIGRWEDDTLVVDTTGIRPDMQSMNGLPSGGKMHEVERFRMTAPDRIRVDTTLESPISFAEPWSYTRTFTRNRKLEILETYCSQNNRDVNPETGFQQFDLTPPPEQ